jgi:hypothetical protein
MPKIYITRIPLAIALLISSSAHSQQWVEIEDASKILWQMSANGTLYFRNLNEFDPKQTGCCYAYALDTTTEGGKSVWSTILAKMAAHKRIALGFPAVGANENLQWLNFIGRHSHASNE